jgi:2-polyprenyl-6-methoxyphenol hydroxylase-like FAD-dependent oxidoreductase
MKNPVDVVILGGGLAGLCLARQLLLSTHKTVSLVEKWPHIPCSRQKVGEATVQLSGYYLSKVLDLEEHLLKKHLMKYNLRFYWKSAGANDSYENYSQSYIRNFSNIPTYQLDRNTLEAEMLRLNLQSSKFTFYAGAKGLRVQLSEGSRHLVRFQCEDQAHEIESDWIVDTTGRSKFLARHLGLGKENPIRHGASFVWVDGLLNIEKLTGRSSDEIRVNKHRCKTGHLPVWLATNHFVGEGFWFWTIPLHGKTSLGLVYDRARVSGQAVNTPEKLVAWVCREFPLFNRQLRRQKITDFGMYLDFSYDCCQTISDQKWAISGEAGRFTDPLYSPGGDLISLYNTLITDCITTPEVRLLKTKARLYEVLMQALYQAYVPSYAVSYDALGDQECFALKYAWELSVYFTFLVFPFINDLFTNIEFVPPYLREFAKLGALNHDLQAFIAAYYQWKKPRRQIPAEVRFFDFTEVGPLRQAEELFYRVGLSPEAALDELRKGMLNLNEMGRYIVAYVYSIVSGMPSLLTNKIFVETIDLAQVRFDPESICSQAANVRTCAPLHTWSFDPHCMTHLQDVISDADNVTNTILPVAV